MIKNSPFISYPKIILTITALLLTPSTLLAVPTDEFYANQWGVRLVMEKPGDPAKTVWDIPNADGNGITIYMIDSGVSLHSDLSFSDTGGDSESGNGHGTAVFGIMAANHGSGAGSGIAGIVPGANVISRKTPIGFNDTLAEFNNLITEATPANYIVQLSRESPPSIININNMCPVINSLINDGGFIVAATGNIISSNTSVWLPSACNNSGLLTESNREKILSVGNSQIDDTRNASSRYSPDHDVFAPGTDIYSTTKSGGYANFTGTSFAAPIVSSAAAILMGCGMPAGNVEAALKASGPAITFPGGSAPRINVYTALENANQTPTGINSDYINLRENLNTGGGLNIATLNIQDSDICDQHQYQILAVNDHALFTLSGADNRQLILNDGELDYERKNQYQITVRATDHFGASVDQILVMAIDNINEAPQINTQTYNLDENSHNNTIVGIINASDPDSGDSINYSITAGNTNNAFDISPTTGQLWVNNSAALDYETQTEFTLTIAVEDTEGLQNSALVTIKLNNIDEPAPTSGTTSPENNPSSGGGLIGFYALLYLFVVYGLRRGVFQRLLSLWEAEIASFHSQ